MRRFTTLVAVISAGCVAGSCRDSSSLGSLVAPAGALIVSGNGQTGRVGEQLAAPLTVLVLGAGGAPDSGKVVRFSVTSGGGTITDSAATTDVNGIASTQWTLGKSVADSQRVQASLGPDTSSSPAVIGTFHAQAEPGPAQIAAVSGSGQSAAPGAALPESLLVRVADTYGNPIAHDTVKWSTSFGSVAPATGISNTQGYVSARWTLASSLGAQTATATASGLTPVVFSATASSSASPIAVTVKTPATNGLVADTLQLKVAVTSTYQLSTVTASVGTRQAQLAYNSGQSAWLGSLPLSGTPFGPTQVVVTATDVNGASASQAVSFVRDDPPLLTVTAPDSFAVATPSLRVQATCASQTASACTQVTVAVVGPVKNTVLASGVSSLDATISLAAYDGQVATLLIQATDAAGQVTSWSHRVSVASIQNMTLLASVPGIVQDVSGSQVLYLYVDSASRRAIMKIRGTSSPDVTVLTSQPYDTVFGARLTPTGAIFGTWSGPGSVPAGVQEYRNGVTSNLGLPPGSTAGLVVNGNYALWETGPGPGVLTLRDLTAGTNTTIANNSADWYYDVTASGDVAYYIQTFNSVYTVVLVPHLGAPEPVQDGASPFDTYPVTDGTHVVFEREIPGGVNQYQVMMWSSGTGLVPLTSLGTRGTVSGVGYQINNGWIAYTDVNPNGGQVQVWSYSPAGARQQVSFLGSSAIIESVGSNGEIVYSGGGQRYLSKAPYTTTVPLGPTLGQVMWRDGHFVVLINGSVFQVQ